MNPFSNRVAMKRFLVTIEVRHERDFTVTGKSASQIALGDQVKYDQASFFKK